MALDHDSDTEAVQTEGTNLAMAYETSLGSRTVPPANWLNIEVNSYGGFGAQTTKTARDVISKSQQLRKPMLTDEATTLSVELDITRDHVDFFAPAVYRSITKHSGPTGQSKWPVSAVTGAHFVVDGLGALPERFLVVGRGFENDENNGLKMVGAGSTGENIKLPGLVAEPNPPANAVADLAGYRGAVGDIELDAAGNLICTAGDFTTWGVHPYQWVYLGGEAAENRFATVSFFGAARARKVEAKKITFDRRSWLVEAQAWLDLADHAANLDSVVRAKLAGPGGNDISVAVVADGAPAVKAELDLDTVTANVDTVIRAKAGGTPGNAISVSLVPDAGAAAGSLEEVGTHVILHYKPTAPATTVAQLEALIATSTLIEVETAGTGTTSLAAGDAITGEALAGGANADAPSVDEVGNGVTLHITAGATTVAQLEAAIAIESTLIEVAIAGTQNTVLDFTDAFVAEDLAGGVSGADDGAGKQIDVYFSRWWRNVAMDHADYRRPSLAAEITFPGLMAGQPGYQYLLGLMVNSWAFNIPVSAKATINLECIGLKTLLPLEARKPGPGDALNPVCMEGVSTSTDVARMRVDKVDELGVMTDFTSMTLTIQNAISREPQIGHVGGKIMNAGKFQQQFSANALFTSAEVLHAVKCNKTCTADVLLRNPDFGALLDIQAMTLNEAPLNMEKDKTVKIGSTGQGFMNGLSGSTGSLSMFAYLPSPADEEC